MQIVKIIAMKTYSIVSILELILSLFLITCDPESITNRSDSEFKVEFSIVP